ncbi:MAG: glycosyltransferase [Verrucomicrobia bacterium]|nr:glycosyltransferase [Verrucomicrobiota bacterium]
MRILFISSNYRTPNHYLARAAYDSISKHEQITEILWGEYHDAIDIALEKRPQVLFVFDGQGACNPIIHRLMDLCPVKVIWFCEDPYEISVNVRTASSFDLVFTNDKASCAAYGSKATYLPLASSLSNNHFPLVTASHRYDIFFAGTAWPNRLKFILELKKRKPNLRWKLILVSNPQLDPYIRDLKGDLPFTNGISIRDFSALANQSAVTLVLPRMFSTSGDINLSSQSPGPRLFEAAVAGACQLVDISAMPVTRHLLEENKTFIPFSSLDDCADAISRLLTNPEKRNEIASNAQSITIAKHLFEDRINTIVDKIININRSILPLDNGFEIKTKPCILMVCHNTVGQGRFGGSEIYQDILWRSLADDYECYVWSHDPRINFGCTYRLTNPKGEEVDVQNLQSPFHDTHLIHQELEVCFQRLLLKLGVDIVFFNHLIGFPPSLVRIQKSLGCRSLFVLHDYYIICDSFNLLNHQKVYCGINTANEDICNACTYKRRGLLPGSQFRRRRFFREVMTDINVIISGSQSSQSIALDLFPHLKDKFHQHPPVMNRPVVSNDTTALDSEKFHVALVGNFSENKGAKLGLQLFQLMSDTSVHFHIFGQVHLSLAEQKELMACYNVTIHGAYPHGNPHAALKNCSVGLILSNWPETYCMVLSELWELGLVPVSIALGALEERINDGVDGILIKKTDPHEIKKTLINLCANKSLLDRIKSNRPKNPCAGAVEYTLWLKNILANLRPTVIRRPLNVDKVVAMDKFDLGIFLNNGNWGITQRIISTPSPPPKNVVWHKRIYRAGVAFKKAIKIRLTTLS